MSRNTELNQARAIAHRRVGKARAALIGTALLGSLGIAGGLTAQAVAATPGGSGSSTVDISTSTGDQAGNQASPLVGPSHGRRSHATTKGS